MSLEWFDEAALRASLVRAHAPAERLVAFRLADRRLGWPDVRWEAVDTWFDNAPLVTREQADEVLKSGIHHRSIRKSQRLFSGPKVVSDASGRTVVDDDPRDVFCVENPSSTYGVSTVYVQDALGLPAGPGRGRTCAHSEAGVPFVVVLLPAAVAPDVPPNIRKAVAYAVCNAAGASAEQLELYIDVLASVRGRGSDLLGILKERFLRGPKQTRSLRVLSTNTVLAETRDDCVSGRGSSLNGYYRAQGFTNAESRSDAVASRLTYAVAAPASEGREARYGGPMVFFTP